MGKSKYQQNQSRLVRLNWEDSQVHYKALDEIKKRNALPLDEENISNGQRKRLEANAHNETRKYLEDYGLTYMLGGFYGEEYD